MASGLAGLRAVFERSSFEFWQRSLSYGRINTPDDRLHPSGEHANLNHAWIQGAFESGLHAALEVYTAV